MIKYIVQTTTSVRDYNGNCYHFARITSTKTGKSIVIDGIGGDDNAAALLLRTPDDGTKPVAAGWHEIHSSQAWARKRDWQRMSKFAGGFDGDDYIGKVFEHEVTPKMLRALNRK